jgi:predicted NAD/FAD-dependent oxidoreductase
MDSVGEYLTKGLNAKVDTNIIKISKEDCSTKWTLGTESGEKYTNFDFVVLSIPAPQALELLPQEV